ncbi:hypothetical protein ACFOSC_23490 [Streptantibioticus rubrisoli]|uniref:Uncharacterized protein n=1 Tax=Streptantibioticus rubrisoli TaxID=1387313 RepID=A0ABT1PCI1_9ACTN|nr:hypothetical protein [Streptantibioticus rubrisoli]MCQ4043084.1 hypothetical protein [Streptantibioticus rubrisoli]
MEITKSQPNVDSTPMARGTAGPVSGDSSPSAPSATTARARALPFYRYVGIYASAEGGLSAVTMGSEASGG